MHIMVDTTLGVFVEYLLLTALVHLLVQATGDERSFIFGEYSDAEGRVDSAVYAKQLAVWLTCIVGMKLLVVCILVVFVKEFVTVTRGLLLVVSWNADVKLVAVMLVTPCCMNAVQFWLTDNFIQKGGISMQEVAHGCVDCCGMCLCGAVRTMTGRHKESPRRLSATVAERRLSASSVRTSERRHSALLQAEEDLEGHADHPFSNDLSEALLTDEVAASRRGSRISVSSHHSHRPSVTSQNGHHDNGEHRQSFVQRLASFVEAPEADPFEEQHAAYQASLEKLKSQITELESAAVADRREKGTAELQAKLNEDQMLDAKEQLHKVQQDVRLERTEKELLRDRLAVKEEREQQLILRIQQLEFNYSAAGAAANAVFAAEVSAASVAASSHSGGRRPGFGGNMQALSADDSGDKSTIAEFLTSSAAKSVKASSSLVSPTSSRQA